MLLNQLLKTPFHIPILNLRDLLVKLILVFR